MIYEEGIYEVEFILIGSRTIEEFSGCVQIVSGGMSFSKREIKVLSDKNRLKFIV